MLLVGIIVVAAMGLFISGKIRIDIIAVCVLVVLFATGLIGVEQVLYGFANQATVTIAAMFILSAGLVRTGLVEWVARHLDRLSGKKEIQLISVLCLTIAVLSAFIINTATVAIFIPVAMVLARNRKIASSRVLMPLSFASQFGGVCTLIGTSTNLIVNSIAVSKGLSPFGFFEFLPLGLAMVVVGAIYLILAGRWLLPVRKGEAEQVDKYRLADYFAEMQVNPKSSLIGKTWDKSKVSNETKVDLTNLLRGVKAVSRPSRTKIKAEDIMLLHGHIEQIMDMEAKYGLKLLKNARMSDQHLSSHNMKLTEVLIPPRSNLIGVTLQTSAFFRRYKATILAIQRRGRVLRERLSGIKLAGGDTLLIQGQKDDISRLMNSPNVIITNELTELYFRKDRALVAIGVLLLVIILTTLNIIPIMLAAIIGAVGIVLARCLTIEEAYSAIDLKIIFLLGGILPLGLALEQAGAAAWLTDSFLMPLAGYGPLMVLAVIYLIATLLTQAMSNNAAAAILAPIAITTAVSLNVDPRPFLIAITFAASTSFATPIGYQTNTMVYSPGGYRFTDFTRVGGPLNIIFWGVSVLLIPVIWHF